MFILFSIHAGRWTRRKYIIVESDTRSLHNPLDQCRGIIVFMFINVLSVLMVGYMSLCEKCIQNQHVMSKLI